MEDVLLDEVKTSRTDNSAKISLIGSVVVFLCFSVKIFLNFHSDKGTGFILDCLLLLFSAISSFISFRKLVKRKKQYIQWWSTKLCYKLGDDIEPREISLDAIVSISVGMDEIIIQTSNNQNQRLKIFDFVDYKDRIRIKSNFEKIHIS